MVSNSDVRSPIITLGSTSFFHVRVNNLYVVAVTKYVFFSRSCGLIAKTLVRSNANAALVFEFCYRFINIAKSYFRKVDEESVKNNFTLIYELIDGKWPKSQGFLVSLGCIQKSAILDILKTAK